MLTKMWTGSLLFLLFASLVALAVAVAYEKDFHPLRDFAARFRRLPFGKQLAVIVFVCAMWAYASIKPGDGDGNGGGGDGGGGTNNVPQMVPGPGNLDPMSLPGGGLQGLQGQAHLNPELHPVNQPVGGGATLNLVGFEPITSTNTTRTLEAADFERGFVMARVGTGEGFDFVPPPDATVVSDWRSFGAATDWIYANVEWKVESGKWRMENGERVADDETKLRIHSNGWVEVRDGPVFWPFKAVLGIVPEVNWLQILHFTLYTLHSQTWYAVTQDNTLVVTWQNALLDRDAGKPVSFQVEFFTDGRFVFRYDLSRLGGGEAANVLAGASFCGNEWATNSLPTNVTSMAFYPLSEDDAYDQDPDGDGLLTIDELFFYNTDPHNADTDYDGLNDGDELLVYCTDPLDPHSVSADYLDGVAVKLGDLNPFDCPEGSTNTVLEHVFYSGTTNGVIAYPQSSVDSAVLEVSVSGTGTGRLVVGDSVVPLVAPPPMRSGAVTNTLLLAVGKGVLKEVWFDKPDGLDVAVRSDDLLIGRMPTWYRLRGWLAFPHTDATFPCIHDFYAKCRVVSLVHGEEFAGLTATWNSEAQGVSITNLPPVSAEIHGRFPKSQTRSISYTVDHPDRLNEEPVAFTQTLRFCPQPPEAEELDDPPDDEVDPFYDCNCGWSGTCNCCTGEWCHCYCWECPCNANQSPTLVDDEDAEESFTNIVSGTMTPLAHVLYLYRANTDNEHLVVPSGSPSRCCPCPDHWQTNYVAKAFSSRRLAVNYAGGGEEFRLSHTPCDVTISGVSPSKSFSDASVLFVTNGATYKRTDYTVLGVKIDRPSWETPIEKYAQLSASFGFPVEVCSNLNDASTLVLRTDVLLGDGYVRVALEDVTGDFEIWLQEWYDNQYTLHESEKLLDGASCPERFFSIRKWRNIIRRYSDIGELGVKVRSLSVGSCKLRLDYVATNGGCRVHDFAEQKISSISPVLLADYDRDGVIGDVDIARHMAGRYAYFWQNDDKWKGDNAFESSLINRYNSSDGVVNGRIDLVNFLPIAVDIATLSANWSSGAVYYRLEGRSSALRNAKLSFADIAWSQIGDAPLGNDMDIDGNALYEAPVLSLGGGTNLPPAFVSLSQSGSSVLLMEFPEVARCHDLCLNVYSKSDSALLFSASLKLHVGEVSKMLGWENLRGVAGGSGGVPTRLATDDWPASEHEVGNLVFVHGYNMEEDVETPLWANNVFKKLWWAGLDRGFVAVQWNGDRGQLFGTITPNYYGNVQNAFQTASALSNAMEDVQGPKWFLAHSLGNMLVSAAIQDYEMEYEKYFMLNAAIALEAFDPTNGISQASHDNMTPEAWTNYTDNVRATHWFERFPESDGRRLLTWKGRFANVTNIVNFYSTQEEVVNNGDGIWHTLARRNYVWYNQETRKGLWPMMWHEYEGGWEFNPYYDTHPEGLTRHMNPTNAAALTDAQLQQTPFFLDFYNPEMYTSPNGAIVATNYLYRAEMLAYAIPAESYAVGANPLPRLTPMVTYNLDGDLYCNHDMATLFTYGRDDLPENHATDTEKKHRDWQHSTFVQRSYKRVHQLYKVIIRHVKETQHE